MTPAAESRIARVIAAVKCVRQSAKKTAIKKALAW